LTVSKTIATLFIALLPVTSCAQTEYLNLSAPQWREDLAFLALELPKRHANAFHYTPRERFEAGVASLDRQIAHLDTQRSLLGNRRVWRPAAGVDARPTWFSSLLVGRRPIPTDLQTPRDSANLPIEIVRFGENYSVASVAAGLESALGARVLKAHEAPISRAAEIVRPLAARDENPRLAQAFIEDAVTTGTTLHGFGITPDRNAARYTRENPDSRFWCRYLPDARTMYCNVRAMQNLYIASKDLLRLVAQHNPDKLVVDLRQDGGGYYTVGERWLVHPIRDLASINREGHLFVLVGAVTFPAAMKVLQAAPKHLGDGA